MGSIPKDPLVIVYEDLLFFKIYRLTDFVVAVVMWLQCTMMAIDDRYYGFRFSRHPSTCEWIHLRFTVTRQKSCTTQNNSISSELFTLPHLFLLDSYWTPGLLLDFTRTPANFILADHHTNLVFQSYWSPSKFLLESLGIADS